MILIKQGPRCLTKLTARLPKSRTLYSTYYNPSSGKTRRAPGPSSSLERLRSGQRLHRSSASRIELQRSFLIIRRLSTNTSISKTNLYWDLSTKGPSFPICALSLLSQSPRGLARAAPRQAPWSHPTAMAAVSQRQQGRAP